MAPIERHPPKEIGRARQIFYYTLEVGSNVDNKHSCDENYKSCYFQTRAMNGFARYDFFEDVL